MELEIITNIKNALLKYFQKETWEQYINSQRFGNCDRIAFIVSKICNKFKIVQLDINYSKLAIQQLHKVKDYGQMYGNHFLNMYNNTLYDFGKGTNSIRGIYLLKFNQLDKYTVELSNEERSLIKQIHVRIFQPNRYLFKKQFLNIVKEMK